MAVMDTIEGWEEEETWVGSRFAAVLCQGQASTQEYLRRRLISIMESVDWVCDDVLEDHEWVSELTISMQENEVSVALNYEIEVPCVVQWRLLWFSSPARLSQRYSDNGTKVPKYHEVMNMAIEATFTLSFGGSHTPRTRLLRSVGAVVYRSPDKDWDVEKFEDTTIETLERNFWDVQQ